MRSPFENSNWWRHSFWNHDGPFLEEYDEHPIWLGLSPDGRYAYAGAFWNSNAKSFTLTPEKVTWRTSGGMVDMIFVLAEVNKEIRNEFVGESAFDIVQRKLIRLLGFWDEERLAERLKDIDPRPPRWTLGEKYF